MTRKVKSPFGARYYAPPDTSRPIDRRTAQVVGEYLLHLGEHDEACFLRNAPGLPVTGVTVIRNPDGSEFDLCWTWKGGKAEAAMRRMPAARGWFIFSEIDTQIHWRRPAPTERRFVG